MSKKLAIPLIIVAFIIGMIVGGWSISFFWEHLNRDLMTSSAAAETSLDVAILKELRTKNNVTNAIDVLEIRLDSSIGELGLYLNEIPKIKRDPQDLKSLQIAKNYREKYPRTYPHTDVDYSEIDQFVSNAFLLVSDQTN
jgi:hypothetical protein